MPAPMQECPRCHREVRSGAPWAMHRDRHMREDRAGQPAEITVSPAQLGHDVLRRTGRDD